MSLELVVARYTETLNWLRNIPPQIRTTVYDESGDQSTPLTSKAQRFNMASQKYAEMEIRVINHHVDTIL